MGPHLITNSYEENGLQILPHLKWNNASRRTTILYSEMLSNIKNTMTNTIKNVGPKPTETDLNLHFYLLKKKILPINFQSFYLNKIIFVFTKSQHIQNDIDYKKSNKGHINIKFLNQHNKCLFLKKINFKSIIIRSTI